tara:strand:- start:5569 stop:6063 length:495 start_codon:yes stop_codon:yes gene_type:complete
MNLPDIGDSDAEKLAESYRLEIDKAMKMESQKRILQNNDPNEISRLQNLSLIKLHNNSDKDLIPALMARLGPVRAALDGHGGGIIIDDSSVEKLNNGKYALSLILNLDGACISCGAAPGTLQGIQDDLIADKEVISVQFSKSMLDWFNDLQRDFILQHGGVSFI